MKTLLVLLALLGLTGCDFIADINAEIGFSEEELAKSKAKVEQVEACLLYTSDAADE